jgi:hypothetical protein
MAITIRILFIFSTIFVSGCAVLTTQPLSDPLTAETDPNLLGHWVETFTVDGVAKEIHYFIGKHTTVNNPESIMECVSIEWQPKENQFTFHKETWYFSVANINNQKYASIFANKDENDYPPPALNYEGSYEDWATSKNKRCWILRYQCDGKTLQVWGEKDLKDRLEAMIKNGQLKGHDGTITVDSLVKYLRKYGGNDLFNESGGRIFKKIP